jgi:hypothetical protein
MYVGCNGATSICACCIVIRVHICEKICFYLWELKKRLQVCMGKWKRHSQQVAWGEANPTITDAP